MRVVWVNPSFLDYRVPVYVELDRLLGHHLTVVYSEERTPSRVSARLKAHMGDRAVGLRGERKVRFGSSRSDLANAQLVIPYQPQLISTVMRTKADVVVGEGFFQWTPACVVKKLLHGSRLLISYERTAHTERNCPWWRTRYRKAVVRIIDAMLCNGDLSAEYAQMLGMPIKRIVTGGMAADSSFFRTASAATDPDEISRWRSRLPGESPIFLYTGQITVRKGIRELLLGWEAYRARGGCGSLVLAGDGPELSEMQRVVEQRNLGNVEFLGHVAYAELPKLYQAADVFVIATLEDNWSLVVPEAMACGLPVACSKYNGCWPELIDEGTNGTVFDPFNPQDVARALCFFARNRSSLPAMGRQSREIESRFSPQTAAAAALRCCEIALANRHGRRSPVARAS